MSKLPHLDFALRLSESMKAQGHRSSRSPNGVCMKTLAEFADASEQICRRYMRGVALPSHDKIIRIANALKVSPAWLLFGETQVAQESTNQDDEVLAYLLTHALRLYPHTQVEEYVDFILSLHKEIQEIQTSKANLLKIIDLALGSLKSFQPNKKAI